MGGMHCVDASLAVQGCIVEPFLFQVLNELETGGKLLMVRNTSITEGTDYCHLLTEASCVHIRGNRGNRCLQVQLGPQKVVHVSIGQLAIHVEIMHNKATHQLCVFQGEGTRATGN